VRVSYVIAAASCALLQGMQQASAQAGPAYCASLKQVIGQVPASFAGLSGDPLPGRGHNRAATLKLDGAASCSITETESAWGPPDHGYFCEWRGGFAAARALYGATEACLGGDTSKDKPLPPGGPIGPAQLAAIQRTGLVIVFQASEASTTMMVVAPSHPYALLAPGKP
jgi:hypothetical protein